LLRRTRRSQIRGRPNQGMGSCSPPISPSRHQRRAGARRSFHRKRWCTQIHGCHRPQPQRQEAHRLLRHQQLQMRSRPLGAEANFGFRSVETPRVNGYSFVYSAPSPSPASLGAPPLTWAPSPPSRALPHPRSLPHPNENYCITGWSRKSPKASASQIHPPRLPLHHHHCKDDAARRREEG